MTAEIRAELARAAALWSVGVIRKEAVIDIACNALVAGLDSQALRELAGASRSAWSSDVEDLLEKVAEELGFQFYARWSVAGREAATRVRAAQCLSGELRPAEFASWVHDVVGHGHPNPSVDGLASLADEYDIVHSAGRSSTDIDSAVVLEAQRLLES